MKIKFECIHCGKEIEGDDDVLGTIRPCPNCNEEVAVPAAHVAEGVTIGAFKVLSKLGSGAMGDVYKAIQLSVNRTVALKVFKHGMHVTKEAVERFLNEAKLTARLDHPNIITVFDAGSDGSFYYTAMAYVEGESFEERLNRDKKVPPYESVAICIKVAEAMNYAWNEHQMIHRDIKPANIMIDKYNEIKLLDLGLAKNLLEDQSMTATGTILGTPYYLSPEMAKSNEQIDFSSDIYSLGATLFHLICGEPPFTADNVIAVLTAHVTKSLPPMANYTEDVPRAIETLILTMMAKNPHERHVDWRELIDEMETILSQCTPDQLGSISFKSRTHVQPASPGMDVTLDANIELSEPEFTETDEQETSDEDINLEIAEGPKKKSLFIAAVIGVAFLLFVMFSLYEPPSPPPRESDTTLMEKWESYQGMSKNGSENLQKAKTFLYGINLSEAADKLKKDVAEEKIELARLLEKRNSSLDAEIKTLLDKLADDSKPALAANNFVSASEIYENYKGKYAKESLAARNEVLANIDKLESAYKKSISDFEKSLENTVKLLMEQNHEKLVQSMKNLKNDAKKMNKSLIADIDMLAELCKPEEMILSSYEAKKGPISIELVNGRLKGHRLKEVNIDEKYLCLQYQLVDLDGKKMMLYRERKVTVAELSWRDILERTKSQADIKYRYLEIVLAIQNKDIKAAKKFLPKIKDESGTLAGLLRTYCNKSI
ncbi:MAG: protein kinase [Lentisphaeria bacterium]|nr:protein kinase [Lentisphaeria bacterium]